MKINKRFNKLTKKEYFYLLDNRKKYKNFNEFGIYRSILENEKLTLAEKIEVRDYAHQFFSKTFDFYQLKDPWTYVELTTLGMELTTADKQKIWDDVRANQQKILQAKRIKHRNFGDYSKHNCGYDGCYLDGVMIKQGSFFSEGSMQFATDECKYSKQQKSAQRKKTTQKQTATYSRTIL